MAPPGDSMDDFATPDEKPDQLWKMWIDIGDNIDLFTDLPPGLILRLNNVLVYADELERFAVKKHGKNLGFDPAKTLRRALINYMRLSVSKSRKSRKEVEGILGERYSRVRETISYQGDNPGGPVR